MDKPLRIKLLLTLIAIFGLITIISGNFSNANPNLGLYEKNSRIRSNGSWIITSTIHIDDSNPSINWSKTAADNSWCSGTGTWNDPYLIENITIDGLFEGSCIYIENSNVPFVIRNCILVNIGAGADPSSDSGIRLNAVLNGLIINNTCSFNNGRGINLRNSHNNTVCFNNVSNNERTGILFYTSNVNTIFGNTFNYNDEHGIYIYQSNFNNFSDNYLTQTKVSTSDFSARYIELTGQNNIFSGNIFKNYGIRLREGSLSDLSSHQIDTTNLVNGKPIYYYANTNDLKKESFSNAGQVILVGSDNCEISGLNMSYGGPGISLFHCDQNTVFNNTLSFRYGEIIKLYSSHQNNISHNSINDVGISPGINLRYSNENYVAYNQIINCNTAIDIGTSDLNTIRDNYLDNNYRGISIQNSQIEDMNNIIMRNIISNNSEGIYTTSPYTTANTIYLNNFINNGLNAENNGGSNYWDNGSIGNYWDDYEGNDTDDDGIGDTPYNIPGTAGDQDNFPIWDDGFNGNPILIDDIGTQNWVWARSKIWCSGSGTWSDPFIIENLIIDAEYNGSCIEIRNSDVYFIVRNCTLYQGGYEETDAGIYLSNVRNGLITLNNCSNNLMDGIRVSGGENNTISLNNAMNNGYCGIDIRDNKNNLISKNTASENNHKNIYINSSDNNTITENNMSDHTTNSYMRLLSSYNNTICSNFVNNSEIELLLSSENKFWNNTLIGNSQIILSDSSHLNLVYQNYFRDTSIGDDNGVSNQWDNGTIGNYWEDYNGKDVDDDGIGDTPYDIYGSTGSQDNFPIWWDSLIISINSPQMDDISELSPNFNISIDEGITNTTWYSLDDGITNITFVGLTGNIDETEWYQRVDGLVDIKFFANDSRGYIGFSEVTVFKETLPPDITINTPTLNEVFEFNTPEFNITIDDLSPINTTWYTIDGGLTNYTFSEINDFINQTAWDQTEDGVITIKFYANDSLGNLGLKVLNVIKDTALPVITIISPNNIEIFGTTAPSFNVEIYEANLDTLWYSLDNGLTNTTFTANGTIVQSRWDTLLDGTVAIAFYANDSAGKIGFSSVTVRVDKTLPTIVINSPISNELFTINAPSFNVEISDTNLDTMWNTINGGLTKYFFLTNSSLNLAAWAALSDGVILIQFYTNDTAGNSGFAEVAIRKDVNAPVIVINNPQNSDVIRATAPNFGISIEELYLDKTWYSLNGGNNIVFTGLTGTIDQALWDALPEGDVIIRFYANDTLGRLGSQEVTVVKTISQSNPPGIPGYNMILLLGIVSIITLIIVKKRLNH